MNTDLSQLGDNLEAAISQRTSPHRRRILTIAAVACLVLVAVSVFAALDRDSPAETVTVIDAPMLAGNDNPTQKPDADGDAFAQQVFSHLPAASAASVTCTTTGSDRYRCTLDGPASTTTGEQRMVFRDRSGVTAGACRSTDEERTTWDCATNTVAVDDGLLDFDELHTLTSL